jgi:hypothetical protein
MKQQKMKITHANDKSGHSWKEIEMMIVNHKLWSSVCVYPSMLTKSLAEDKKKVAKGKKRKWS